MSGSNRPINGHRQRNFSDTSSSSFKDHTSVNQQRVSENEQRRTSRPPRTPSSSNGVRERQPYVMNTPLRDLQRPTAFFDSSTDGEQQHQDLQEKLRELQQKKWQYDNAMTQLQHLHSSFSEEPTPNAARAELANNETMYSSIDSRTRKLQEAQQKLLQLQELMQNVSIDLDCNPFAQPNDDKNNKPKEFSLDFLRNVPSNTPPRATAIPRVNASRNKGLQQASYHYSPQNNLSHESFGSPKRYSTSSQVNGSLFDAFARSEPSFDSSNEDVEEHPLAPEEEMPDVPMSQDPLLLNGDTSANNSIRVPNERLDRIESQLERTCSLCELLVVEQRRLSSVTESLYSAVLNMQGRQHRSPAGFTLSSLPVNSTWNENGSDFQMLAQAVGQCCQMLTQLQRDLAAVQMSVESSPQIPEAGRTSNPFRESKSRTSYECATMDRFDPEVTLNNRVPPGTRTNNYWDNFRSYSRQNLLSNSSAPSNVADQQQLTTTDLLIQQGSHQLQASTASYIDARALPRTGDSSQHPRRTKRKVNKGQRQVELGVHCPPHADNRALAYDLLSVRGTGSSSNGSVGNSQRNLNQQRQQQSEATAAAVPVPTGPEAANNKVVKDTSTLKYSGARPKENRRPAEPPLSAVNVNLLAEPQGLESIIRSAVTEHADRPQFLTQLLELVHKFDSDPMRQMALNALHDCVTDNHQSELSTIFNRVVGHQRELTPALLDAFLASIQQEQHDDVESAAAAAAALPPQDGVYLVRQTLAPFLFRRLSEVHDRIVEALNNLEPGNTATASGQEDDLAEADQSCEGVTEVPSSTDDQDVVLNQRHSSAGLDEVPTRLMSMLSPPLWARPSNQTPLDDSTRSSSSNNSQAASNSSGRLQRPESEPIGNWFPEDGGI